MVCLYFFILILNCSVSRSANSSVLPSPKQPACEEALDFSADGSISGDIIVNSKLTHNSPSYVVLLRSSRQVNRQELSELFKIFN
jgi:hypothetical protein